MHFWKENMFWNALMKKKCVLKCTFEKIICFEMHFWKKNMFWNALLKKKYVLKCTFGENIFL
jgi:hypothetical protein